MLGSTSAGSASGARSTNAAPPACAAAASARLVFPVPPGPVRVSKPDLGPLEQTGERGELEVAADQLGARSESRIQGVDCPGCELRVVLQDPALECSQLRRRLETQLVQGGTGVAVGGKRVGLAAGAVQGEHPLCLEPLAVRVARRRARRAHRRASRGARVEVGVDTRLERRPAGSPRAAPPRPGQKARRRRRRAPGHARARVPPGARRPPPRRRGARTARRRARPPRHGRR